MAAERARLLIEQAEALGEPSEDPLLLFSVFYGIFVTNLVAFKGDVVRALAAQVLTLAEKQKASFPLVLGHNFLGHSLILTGDMTEGRTHLDQAIALYDPSAHRRLATRFGEDQRVPSLCFRSSALWFLGYPEAALADAHHAISYAREVGQAATLMFALCHASLTEILCGNYASANGRSVSSQRRSQASETRRPWR